jgi:hypothetical protein
VRKSVSNTVRGESEDEEEEEDEDDEEEEDEEEEEEKLFNWSATVSSRVSLDSK